MIDHKFLRNYFKDFAELLEPDNENVEDLLNIRNLIQEVASAGKKILIFGNGGSAAIASHVSVDLTKNAKVRCLNLNEASLITCFSNDYGFDHWVEKAVDFYGDEGDLLILISSSSESKNMINYINAARNGNLHSIITFTGFSKDNSLKKLGNINLWVDSYSYNFVENIHQIWLLAITDLLIGKREYSA